MSEPRGADPDIERMRAEFIKAVNASPHVADDLVERLRTSWVPSWDAPGFGNWIKADNALLREAADQIESLRAEVKEGEARWERCHNDYLTIFKEYLSVRGWCQAVHGVNAERPMPYPERNYFG
jgi:hypothetical protein